MAKRKKRLIKQIKGLEKQAEKHKLKIKTEEGRKDTTHDYWRTEIAEFERRKKQRQNLLKELKKK